MAKTLETGARVAPKLKITSKMAPDISQDVIAEAFGATRVSSASVDLWQLREQMRTMLASQGGRPSIARAHGQVKIPRIEEDWVALEQITRLADGLPRKPSVTQAAALVLHLALRTLDKATIDAELHRVFDEARE